MLACHLFFQIRGTEQEARLCRNKLKYSREGHVKASFKILNEGFFSAGLCLLPRSTEDRWLFLPPQEECICPESNSLSQGAYTVLSKRAPQRDLFFQNREGISREASHLPLDQHNILDTLHEVIKSLKGFHDVFKNMKTILKCLFINQKGWG